MKKRFDLDIHFCTGNDFFFNEYFSFSKSFNSLNEIEKWAKESLPVLRNSIRTAESNSYIKEELIEAFDKLEAAINYEQDYDWTSDSDTYIKLEVVTEEPVLIRMPLELYEKMNARKIREDELIHILEKAIK